MSFSDDEYFYGYHRGSGVFRYFGNNGAVFTFQYGHGNMSLPEKIIGLHLRIAMSWKPTPIVLPTPVMEAGQIKGKRVDWVYE